MRITLLTDFGTADGYVAAMKGAIAEIAPSVLIDDASHAIAPGDITAAAFALRRYWRRYPQGTIHVVVVDPGVGSDRRALAVAADGRFLIAPDNGVLSFVLADAGDADVFEIAVAAPASRTFHGRDVFAPAAGRLAAGMSIERLGPPVTDPVTLIVPPPIATESSVRGEIVHVDRFGNLVSNIPRSLLQAAHSAFVGERRVRVVETYSDAAPGDVIALVNSDEMVEIAVRDGSAARRLGLERGAPLELRLTELS